MGSNKESLGPGGAASGTAHFEVQGAVVWRGWRGESEVLGPAGRPRSSGARAVGQSVRVTRRPVKDDVKAGLLFSLMKMSRTHRVARPRSSVALNRSGAGCHNMPCFPSRINGGEWRGTHTRLLCGFWRSGPSEQPSWAPRPRLRCGRAGPAAPGAAVRADSPAGRWRPQCWRSELRVASRPPVSAICAIVLSLLSSESFKQSCRERATTSEAPGSDAPRIHRGDWSAAAAEAGGGRGPGGRPGAVARGPSHRECPRAVWAQQTSPPVTHPGPLVARGPAPGGPNLDPGGPG